MGKKRERPAVTINAAIIDAPIIDLEAVPTIAEELEFGTSDEVRDALQFVAHLLLNGRGAEISPGTQKILGKALWEIGHGADPGTALGLKRKKKFGVAYAKKWEWMIQDLMKQGLSRAEAEELLGRYNHNRGALEDIQGADEKLKKRLARARTK